MPVQVRPKCRQCPPGAAAANNIVVIDDVARCKRTGGPHMVSAISLPGLPSAGLSTLLSSYLFGDVTARDKFPVEIANVLTKLAGYHGSFLPVDIRPEVVNETHLLLL